MLCGSYGVHDILRNLRYDGCLETQERFGGALSHAAKTPEASHGRIWQISGRSNLAFDRQVELDIQYIATRSVMMDIAILLRTIPAVLTARGAY